MKFTPLLDDLISKLQVLPGIGPKSAQRIAFNLLSKNRKKALDLASSMQRAMNEICECKICHSYSDNDVCNICANQKRQLTNSICVVENPSDIVAIENTSQFFGVYFVLHGHISPLDGIGPNELRLPELENLFKIHRYKEVIVAINPSIEGSMTTYYIADLAKKYQINVSILAQGIPVGGELDNLDVSTISYSLTNRKNFN